MGARLAGISASGGGRPRLWTQSTREPDMNNVPGEIRVTTDPRNPGEFFACCGLLELADRLWPCGAEGRFADASFVLTPVKAGQGGQLIDLVRELATVEPKILDEAGDDDEE